MKDQYINSVGVWGRRRYDYLKQNCPTVLNVMRMNGTLESHLRQIDRNAEEMICALVKQYAKQEGVTEELKRRDQMAWVGAMNNIRDRVNEADYFLSLCIVS